MKETCHSETSYLQMEKQASPKYLETQCHSCYNLLRQLKFKQYFQKQLAKRRYFDEFLNCLMCNLQNGKGKKSKRAVDRLDVIQLPSGGFVQICCLLDMQVSGVNSFLYEVSTDFCFSLTSTIT